MDVNELARDSVLSELLCFGELVLMSEMIERLWNKFINGRRLLRASVSIVLIFNCLGSLIFMLYFRMSLRGSLTWF